MGNREIKLLQLGQGHTKGDIVVWLPDERILFSGDLVEYSTTPYTGDAYLQDWALTLDNIRALSPQKLVPGRGAALHSPELVEEAITNTRSFIKQLYQEVSRGIKAKKLLKEVYKATEQRLKPQSGNWVIFDHCMPFDVSRAFDEASGIKEPRIWTADRDKKMWQDLENES